MGACNSNNGQNIHLMEQFKYYKNFIDEKINTDRQADFKILCEKVRSNELEILGHLKAMKKCELFLKDVPKEPQGIDLQNVAIDPKKYLYHEFFVDEPPDNLVRDRTNLTVSNLKGEHENAFYMFFNKRRYRKLKITNSVIIFPKFSYNPLPSFKESQESSLEEISITSSKVTLNNNQSPYNDIINCISLDLSYDNVEKIPESLCKLINLEFIGLKRNKLKSLPNEFSELDKLREIDLSENEFEIFPSVVLKAARCLEKLNLNTNYISSLDINYVIPKCPLKFLFLCQNKFKAIPKEIDKFEYIKFVYLDDNLIDEISPETIENFNKINVKMSLRNNKMPIESYTFGKVEEKTIESEITKEVAENAIPEMNEIDKEKEKEKEKPKDIKKSENQKEEISGNQKEQSDVKEENKNESENIEEKIREVINLLYREKSYLDRKAKKEKKRNQQSSLSISKNNITNSKFEKNFEDNNNLKKLNSDLNNNINNNPKKDEEPNDHSKLDISNNEGMINTNNNQNNLEDKKKIEHLESKENSKFYQKVSNPREREMNEPKIFEHLDSKNLPEMDKDTKKKADDEFNKLSRKIKALRESSKELVSQDTCFLEVQIKNKDKDLINEEIARISYETFYYIWKGSYRPKENVEELEDKRMKFLVFNILEKYTVSGHEKELSRIQDIVLKRNLKTAYNLLLYKREFENSQKDSQKKEKLEEIKDPLEKKFCEIYILNPNSVVIHEEEKLNLSVEKIINIVKNMKDEQNIQKKQNNKNEDGNGKDQNNPKNEDTNKNSDKKKMDNKSFCGIINEELAKNKIKILLNFINNVDKDLAKQLMDLWSVKIVKNTYLLILTELKVFVKRMIDYFKDKDNDREISNSDEPIIYITYFEQGMANNVMYEIYVDTYCLNILKILGLNKDKTTDKVGGIEKYKFLFYIDNYLHIKHKFFYNFLERYIKTIKESDLDFYNI